MLYIKKRTPDLSEFSSFICVLVYIYFYDKKIAHDIAIALSEHGGRWAGRLRGERRRTARCVIRTVARGNVRGNFKLVSCEICHSPQESIRFECSPGVNTMRIKWLRMSRRLLSQQRTRCECHIVHW